MENILVICAHPDDEVLGCGGTLLKHKSKKDQINILYVYEGSTGRNKSNKSITNLNLQKRKKCLNSIKIFKSKIYQIFK